MAFDDIIRPDGLAEILTPRNPNNQSGFQGAHILGNAKQRAGGGRRSGKGR